MFGFFATTFAGETFFVVVVVSVAALVVVVFALVVVVLVASGKKSHSFSFVSPLWAIPLYEAGINKV